MKTACFAVPGRASAANRAAEPQIASLRLMGSASNDRRGQDVGVFAYLSKMLWFVATRLSWNASCGAYEIE